MTAVDARKTLLRERLRWLWTIFLILLAVAGLAVFNAAYTNRVERQSQRDFCDLMRVFDDPTAPPPTTDRGRRQVAAIRDYLAKRC